MTQKQETTDWKRKWKLLKGFLGSKLDEHYYNMQTEEALHLDRIRDVDQNKRQAYKHIMKEMNKLEDE